MIYTVGSKKLNIPETGTERKIRTPRQVVPYRDVAETCRNIDAVCSLVHVPAKRPMKIIDGVARAGFWGGVFLERWPDCQLHLNEESTDCLEILRKNYEGVQITMNSMATWTPPKSDILLLDFDDFTLRKSDKHKPILQRVAPTTDWLMVADNTCFGFKFGNLRHYGVSTDQEYYELLDREMAEYMGGKRVIAVSAFSNAAMILYGKRKGDEITYLPPTNLHIARGLKSYKNVAPVNSSKGFGLCAGIK